MSSKYDNCVAKSIAKWESDYRYKQSGIFRLVWPNINNRIPIEIETCLWYEWNTLRPFQFITTFHDGKADRWFTWLLNSAIVKVAQTLKGESAVRLVQKQWSASKNLRHNLCSRWHACRCCTFHTAVKNDGESCLEALWNKALRCIVFSDE